MNQKALVIIDQHAINPAGGAYALSFSHFQLMIESGFELKIVLLIPDGKKFSNDLYNGAEIIAVNYDPNFSIQSRLQRFFSFLFEPVKFLFTYIFQSRIRDSLQKIQNEFNPDIVWAEHLLPVTAAYQFCTNVPIIYSHHDWRWKIKKLRQSSYAKTFRKKASFWVSKRHEENLVKNVAGCVSASKDELREIIAFGSKNAGYFPTTYNPVALNDQPKGNQVPRVIHLGGMQTTANKIGLKRFLEIVWPIILNEAEHVPELWVVGSMKTISEEMQTQLDHAGARCFGFVEDLGRILDFGDLHIIPWEYRTGTRTRIPLALNYGQVVVSTTMAAACIAELKDNVNGVLVNSLDHMAHKIIDLCEDAPKRVRIAKAGRQLFEKNFTIPALQPKFDQFISLIGNRS